MKFMKTTFAALLIAVTMMSSKPSQAAVGLIAAPQVVTAGLIIAGTGGAGVLIINKLADDAGSGALALVGPWLLAIGVGLVGVVVLDGEQGIAYSPLTPEAARKINMSKMELESFNREIDEVNALASYVDSQVSHTQGATDKDAAAIWAEVKHSIAPETFSALVKVTQQLYK